MEQKAKRPPGKVFSFLPHFLPSALPLTCTGIRLQHLRTSSSLPANAQTRRRQSIHSTSPPCFASSSSLPSLDSTHRFSSSPNLVSTSGSQKQEATQLILSSMGTKRDVVILGCGRFVRREGGREGGRKQGLRWGRKGVRSPLHVHSPQGGNVLVVGSGNGRGEWPPRHMCVYVCMCRCICRCRC